VAEAARQLTNFRNKKPTDTAEDASADPAAAEQPEELADEADAAPLEEVTGETQEADPAQQPPLDLTRSWDKAKADAWTKLDRATQEYLLEHDSKSSAEIRRAQNEAAEQRKSLETEKGAVAQARQQYEAALPALLQTLHEQQQGEFSDIKTMADVENLARNDWPRYALWDAQQKKIAAVQQELTAAQQRQESEFNSKWSDYASKQDQLLVERVPELADKDKASKLRDAAASVLRDVGFDDKEIASAYTGKAGISLRDARLGQIIIDAAKYREAKTAAAKPVLKAVPPVQRPGTADLRPTAKDAEVQALSERFKSTGSLDD